MVDFPILGDFLEAIGGEVPREGDWRIRIEGVQVGEWIITILSHGTAP